MKACLEYIIPRLRALCGEIHSRCGSKMEWMLCRGACATLGCRVQGGERAARWWERAQRGGSGGGREQRRVKGARATLGWDAGYRGWGTMTRTDGQG